MLPTGTNLEVKTIPKVTIILIVLNVIVFACEPLLQARLGEDARLLTFGTGNPSLIGLFTSFFLHGDLFHIIFNMLFLWVFGPPLEDRVGKKLYLIYYLGSGVTANLFQTLVDIIHDPDSHSLIIGASGAVSGIMGLYLYRCYYSKMKLVVSPLFLPFSIQIPAAPFLILWFLQDVIAGWASFSAASGIANWAHAGGFLFGLLTGRVMKYGHDGAVEHFKGKVLEKIRRGGGWKEAGSERELLKLLKLDPDDPDVYLELGHYYRENDRKDEARTHYLTAINKLLVSKPLFAGYALLDYLETFGKAISPQHHLKAADALAQNGDLEEAFKVLQPVLLIKEPKMIVERIRLLDVKLCHALGKEELEEAIVHFDKDFPGSRYRRELDVSLAKRPDAVFPPRLEEPAEPEPDTEPAAESESKLLLVFHRLISLIVDPLFLFLWFVILFGFFAILPKNLLFVQVLSFAIAFIFAAMYRIDWGELMKDLTIDEAAARLDADTATMYNRAVAADRGDDHAKAAELYEKVLAHDMANIQARFNLSKLYMERMNDRKNGLRHLQRLLKDAPEGHPFKEYAKDHLNSRSPVKLDRSM